MSTTPNLGLSIPVGGTTPGALNNTTPGTYPYYESGNLSLIDSLCYSLNNPVPTAGININADLTFNGFSLLDADNGTFNGVLTVGTLNLTNLTLSGYLHEISPGTVLVMSGNGTATGVGVALDNQTTMTSGGKLVSFRNNTVEKAYIDYNGVYQGTALNTEQLQGVAVSSTAPTTSQVLTYNGTQWAPATGGSSGPTGPAGGDLGGTYPNPEVVSALNDALAFTSGGSGIGAKVITASTGLYLEGNQTATGGPGVIIDNATAATSGHAGTLSLRTGGVEIGSVDYQGNYNIGGYQQTTNTNHMRLYFNTAFASTAYQSYIDVQTVTGPQTTFAFWCNPAALNASAFTWQFTGGSPSMTLTNEYLEVNNGVLGLTQSQVGSSLLIEGAAAATGGIGILIDNSITQTSGKLVSFQNNATEESYIDYAGSHFTNKVSAFTTNTALTLTGTITSVSGGPGIILNNGSVTQTSGNILTVNNNGSAIATLDWEGDLHLNGSLYTNAILPNSTGGLSVFGDIPATGSSVAAVVLTNQIAITSGYILQLSSGPTTSSVVMQADYAGNLFAPSLTAYSANSTLTLAGTKTTVTGTGVIINSGTGTLTSGGKIVVFENNGTQESYIDYAGVYQGTALNTQELQGVSVSSTAPTNTYVLTYNGSQWAPAAPTSGSTFTNITLTGYIQEITSGTSLLLYGNGAAGGTAVVLDNPNTTLTGGGKIVSFRNATTEELYVDYRGFLVAPTTNAASGTLTLQSNIANAANVQGVVLNSLNSLTSGFPVVFQNNATVITQVDNLGNHYLGAYAGVTTASLGLYFTNSIGAGITNTAQIVNTHNSTLTIQANNLSGSNTTAILFNNFSNVTSGNSLYSFQNNSVEIASLDYRGDLNLGTANGTANLVPVIYFNAALGSSSTAYQSSIQGWNSQSSITLGLIYNTPNSGAHQWNIGGTNYMTLTTTQLQLSSVSSIVQETSATGITLKGHTTASGGPSIILDNSTAATSAEVLSIRSGGTELASLNYQGDLVIAAQSTFNLTFSGVNQSITLAGSAQLQISSNLAAGNNGSIGLNAAVAKNAGVAIVQVQNAGTSVVEFGVGGSSSVGFVQANHYKGQGSTPTVGSINSGFNGTSSSISASATVQGTDFGGVITLTTGNGSSPFTPSFTTAWFTVTLNSAYASSQFVPMCNYIDTATPVALIGSSSGTYPLFAVPQSASTFNVYFTGGEITLAASTAYKIAFMTIGAGANY
jgi:hypothetical protein